MTIRHCRRCSWRWTGNARSPPLAGGGRVEGTINDQRFDARVDARLDRPRALLDVDASFGTLDMNRFVARPVEVQRRRRRRRGRREPAAPHMG